MEAERFGLDRDYLEESRKAPNGAYRQTSEALASVVSDETKQHVKAYHTSPTQHIFNTNI